jgi:hypothetical protein
LTEREAVFEIACHLFDAGKLTSVVRNECLREPTS